MKKVRCCRAIIVLVCMLLFVCSVPHTEAFNPGEAQYTNTYINTGNQRADIIGVALTQVGYQELPTNDTKYGDWYGLPEQDWCAMFVSWCARQAEISTDILAKNAWAHPNQYQIKEYTAAEYTPQPGDLFFTKGYGHVGIVWYVEGDFFYCIEGNAKHHDPNVPDDPTVDSYDVMINKRLISMHTFGVPEYRGCDGDHTYVREVEASHPHKVYYVCTECDDRYATGYTDLLPDCSKCFSCGCTAARAGFYELLPTTDYLRLRNGHNWNAPTSCYVTIGSVVYVHGFSKDGYWAYIESGGQWGHIPASYLRQYPDPPQMPALTADQAAYFPDDEISLTWDLPDNTEYLLLQLYRDGECTLRQTIKSVSGHTLKDLPSGSYRAEVRAGNRAGASPAAAVEFHVKDSCVVSFVSDGGTGLPLPQTLAIGSASPIPDSIPSREGYIFLGWAESESTIAVYAPGEAFSPRRDVTLTAVWREESATAQTLTFCTPPDTTTYLPGDALDLSGLTLQLHYSDGTSQLIKSGYDVSGFDSETTGQKTLTFTCGELCVSFPVQVIPYLPGDITGDREITRDDVIALLLHISMSHDFPISVPADFTGDNVVDRDDVIALLLHVSMPDTFPLEHPQFE